MNRKAIAFVLVCAILLATSCAGIGAYITSSDDGGIENDGHSDKDGNTDDDRQGGGVRMVNTGTYYGADGLTYSIVDSGIPSSQDTSQTLPALLISGNAHTISSLSGWYLTQTDGTTINLAQVNPFLEIIKVQITANIQEIGRTFDPRFVHYLELPDSLQAINERAFENNGFITITIPKSVTTIGKYAFAWSRSDSDPPTTDLHILCESPYIIEQYAFQNLKYVTSLILPEGIATIPAYSFAGLSSLSYIQIPSTVTNVVGGAFYKSVPSRCTIEFRTEIKPTIGYAAFSNVGDYGSLFCTIYTHNAWTMTNSQALNIQPLNTRSLYFIDYNVDGNITREFQREDESTILKSSEKEHYNFQGWYDSPSGGLLIGESGQSKTFTIDTILYARFSGKYYTVRYVIPQSGTSPSSIADQTVQYPAMVTLQTVSKQHYRYRGWREEGVTPEGTYLNGDYQPLKALTVLTVALSAVWYITVFKDADGSELARYEQEYDQNTEVDVPVNTHSPIAFNFEGWFVEGSSDTTPYLGTTATKYTPDDDRTFVRKYTYLRNLLSPQKDNGWQSQTITGTVFPGISSSTSLPAQPIGSENRYVNNESIPQLRGYRIGGWGTSNIQASYDSYPETDYANTYTPILNSSDPTVETDDVRFASSRDLYTIWKPAILESLTCPESLSTREGWEVSATAVYEPQDWLGANTIEWDSDEEDASIYFSKTENGAQVVIEGLNNTPAGRGMHLFASAKARSWESAGTDNRIESNHMLIIIATLITVNFMTRADDGTSIPYLVEGHTGNVWYVQSVDGQLEWVSQLDEYDRVFPPNPTRADFDFVGWVDEDGRAISLTKPSMYNAVCYATWEGSYNPAIQRDSLIIQKFNEEGNRLTLQMDMGILSSIREQFRFSLTSVTIPTMSSAYTFTTDLYCSETILVNILRKSPQTPNDDSDNPLNWSNSKWITEVRGLVDRWQSETDGIKMLYIPRGLRIQEVNGTLVGLGDNYDMLGYVLEDDGTNLGLRFDGKILQGYNALITSYNDSYTADSPRVVSVSLTFTLGGMVSQYQDFVDGLILNSGRE